MARLSKEEFLDKSRYTFKTFEVEIPELGGSVEIKALNNVERDRFMDLLGQADKASDEKSRKLAAEGISIAVSDPEMTPDEVAAIMDSLPSTASDRVLREFGDLLVPGKEETAETRSDFHSEDD